MPRLVPVFAFILCATLAVSQPLYTVKVIDGWGGGSHRAGDTVHLFSRALGQREVFTKWTSSADILLERPSEWHTTFVMPEADVDLVAQIDTIPAFTITEEMIRGVARPKRVFHILPPTLRGVVFLYHGTGGSAMGWQPGAQENFALVKDLVAAGLGVVITESEETTAEKDLDGDGKIRWDVAPPVLSASIDYGNLRAILDTLIARRAITSSTPLFGVGMSNGGAFSIPCALALGMKAAVSYCASGRKNQMSVVNIPVLWLMAQNDDNENVGQAGNQEALEAAEFLRQRGVKSEAIIRRPYPVYPEIFTRNGASVDNSRAMVSDLRRGGHLDERGFLIRTSDSVAMAVTSNPSAYPAIFNQTEVVAREIVNTLAAAYAEHKFFADLNKLTVDWLLASIDGSTSVGTDTIADRAIVRDVFDLMGRLVQRLRSINDENQTSHYHEIGSGLFLVVTRYESGRVYAERICR